VFRTRDFENMYDFSMYNSVCIVYEGPGTHPPIEFGFNLIGCAIPKRSSFQTLSISDHKRH
jgi:hypothetical protein